MDTKTTIRIIRTLERSQPVGDWTQGDLIGLSITLAAMFAVFHFFFI